jgi:hypothetical protein
MDIYEPEFFSVESSPYGRTYGHWTVMWWRWFLSIPQLTNPVLDKTGKYAHMDQPAANVWFLAGKIANEDVDLPLRHCRLPAGRSILFPVINFEANPLEYRELKTDQDLIERVQSEEDSIIRKECTVNGKSIPPQRVKTDPHIFELRLPEDNAFSVKGGGTTNASADGYWVFLKALAIGDYAISFEGSCRYGKVRSGANYMIKVREGCPV